MIYSKLKKIKCVVLDVDGVLTDGRILVTETGDQLRTFNVKDGYAIQYAVKKGLLIFVITGAKSQGVSIRFKSLGVDEVHLGISDKWSLMQELLIKHSLELNEVMFIGDDIPDYLCMQKAGVAISPADACEEVKAISDYVSVRKGGEGVVREILEKTLKLQEKWHQDLFVQSI